MARTVDADAVLDRYYAEFEKQDICDGSQDRDWLMRCIEEAPTLTPPNEPLSILVLDEPDREYIDYICPKCKNTISQRRRGQLMRDVYQCKYHDNCGQRVDWHNPQPYRHPTEGQE